MRFYVKLSILCVAVVCHGAMSDSLVIAVASNFSAPMSELSASFQRQTGARVQVIKGSSGKLFAQLNHGAPYDLFFSADHDKSNRLVVEGLVHEKDRFTYAYGRLVLWQPNAVQQVTIDTLTASPKASIALANPKHAPYGSAAMQTLESVKSKTSLQPRLVFGENVAQAYHFANSGNVDIGFVALSQVNQKHTALQWWLVPESLHAPIQQDGVILSRSNHQYNLAKQFLRYMAGNEGNSILIKYGYQPKLVIEHD